MSANHFRKAVGKSGSTLVRMDVLALPITPPPPCSSLPHGWGWSGRTPFKGHEPLDSWLLRGFILTKSLINTTINSAIRMREYLG